MLISNAAEEKALSEDAEAVAERDGEIAGSLRGEVGAVRGRASVDEGVFILARGHILPNRNRRRKT